MQQWLVLIVFLGSGVLQMLCCCVMAATDTSCHSPKAEMAAESCCSMETPEPELKRDCDCQDHSLETGHGVLLEKIQTANTATTAPIPPQINPVSKSVLSFYVPATHKQGHGPPPEPARLCRFLN